MTEQQLELPNIIDYKKDKWEIKISYDECPDSPRTWDNLGEIFVSNGCKYTSNETSIDFDEFTTRDADQDQARLEAMGFIALPLSVYDHSGVSIYIGGKRDKWDSGQIGFYIVSKEKIREEYKVKRISKKLHQRIEKVLIDEINTYNDYINGNVYGFQLIHNDKEEDSCYGFYGNNCLSDMYEYFPDEFCKSFTVEEAKALATWPWDSK